MQETLSGLKKAAKDIREVGNKLWKGGKSQDAFDKWQSASFLFPLSDAD